MSLVPKQVNRAMSVAELASEVPRLQVSEISTGQAQYDAEDGCEGRRFGYYLPRQTGPRQQEIGSSMSNDIELHIKWL